MPRANAIRSYWVEQVKRLGAKHKGFVGVNSIECADGFMLSVQASKVHQCTPRRCLSDGDYDAWEVGFPSKREPLLDPFGDKRDAVFAYVPTAVVNAIIAKHGGLKAEKKRS